MIHNHYNPIERHERVRRGKAPPPRTGRAAPPPPLRRIEPTFDETRPGRYLREPPERLQLLGRAVEILTQQPQRSPRMPLKRWRRAWRRTEDFLLQELHWSRVVVVAAVLTAVFAIVYNRTGP